MRGLAILIMWSVDTWVTLEWVAQARARKQYKRSNRWKEEW